MPNKPTKPEEHPIPRVIVERLHDHWTAWFEGNSHDAFGGDSPGTAVDRLWEAYLNAQDAKRT